jgi:hypothetical protein
MKTRKRSRGTRGSGWWSRKARDWGIYDGPSTSLLAREIYAMLDKKGIKPYRQADFENLMSFHPTVKKSKLLRDLRNLGMTDAQEYEVVANLEYIIPSNRRELTYNQ